MKDRPGTMSVVIHGETAEFYCADTEFPFADLGGWSVVWGAWPFSPPHRILFPTNRIASVSHLPDLPWSKVIENVYGPRPAWNKYQSDRHAEVVRVQGE